MIPFNKPPQTGNELAYISKAMQSSKLSGDGYFAKKCQNWFEKRFNCPKTLLTPSCTHALEMAAILADIQPGDEVIMPSYTFVSTANAFALRGAKIVFVDIDQKTMNVNVDCIEKAITTKTKALVPVHYGGMSCDMDRVMALAEKFGLIVIEDAAQGVLSTYKGRQLGTIGHLAAFSFHETKNYTSGGEGGLLLINDERFIERAEIIREKGTNRSNFFRGMVDKYSWVDIGSSYLPSEIQAAYLWAQLECAEKINCKRLETWNLYKEKLSPLEKDGILELMSVPSFNEHNAHMFFLKVKDITERTKLLKHLKNEGVMAVFHYVPLHSAIAGNKFSRFTGVDQYTTSESERIVRLPLYFGLDISEAETVISAVHSFFQY